MLKKLKIKFLVATVITLVIVIGVIIGAINVFNYRTVINESDAMLNLILSNSGRFPNKPGHMAPDADINFTPETPFESRYFTVVFENGSLKSVNTASIAAVNDQTAINMANLIVLSGIERGFVGNYRYLLKKEGSKSTVIFLDCTKSLDTAHTFFIVSLFVSAMGIFAVFLILWIISDRIVKPIIEGYDKQKRFITDAGHDIKTPITIIDADAELLEMEIGENEWLSDIKKQTSRLATLTSELIYLSRMEEQKDVPHIDFPISDVLEEVVCSFGSLAKTKNIKFNSAISPALFYCGEEESIRKLVTLLIDNAIKYSPEGESVDLIMKRSSRGIIIRISNLAPNITSAQTEHLFDRFYRSDPARSSSGGFGIGLSVAHAIVSSHKGKISAQKQNERLVIEVLL